jgi:3'(2'), 5'-bisphosphate nucleotidase
LGHLSATELTATELADLVAIARTAAWNASALLRQAATAEIKLTQTGDSPVTTADLAANTAILEHLHAQVGTQGFAYLTEETFKQDSLAPHPHPRFIEPYVWIIDPLDGTKDFINRTGQYAVHIALVQNHRPILAVVACPDQERLYWATLGGGTFVETRHSAPQPARVSRLHQARDLTVVTSRSHRGERFNQLMQRFPCQTQIQVGSLGGKIAAIVEQQADVYISLSGKSAPKDWDLAAPELILTEAGGRFTRFDNTPLLYNQADVSQWGGILATNGPCHDFLCSQTTAILTELDTPT